MLPSAGDALDDSDLLSLATEELQTYVVPLLLSVSEEYLVTSEEAAVAVGAASYRIPSDAVAGMLRDVQFAGPDGQFRPLERIEPERVSWYEGTGSPVGFYLAGNQVSLVPVPSSAGTLRFVYHRRPSALVLPSQAAVISGAINPTTGAFAVSSTSVLSSGLPDIVSATASFDILVKNLACEVSGSIVTPDVPADVLGAGVATGDYVCVSGTSPVPQIPVELHPLLAQRTAFAAVEALGDPRAQAIEAKCERLKREALTLLSPRTRGKGRVIINPNAPGRRRNRSRFLIR